MQHKGTTIINPIDVRMQYDVNWANYGILTIKNYLVSISEEALNMVIRKQLGMGRNFANIESI